jgi:raffinose/stachyose/melibiose transport system substrate-binding protein
MLTDRSAEKGRVRPGRPSPAAEHKERVVSKTLRVGTVAALLAVLLTLASGASAKSNAVTLRLLYNNTGSAAMNLLIANFERVNPNIHIEPTYVDGGTPLTTTLLTQLQAGNAPDVFQMQPGFFTPISPWTLGKAGYLLNLAGSPWQKRVLPSAKNWVTYQNKLYAWPLTLGPHGVAFNTDLFAQLGLKVPTTFSQFVAMCPKIKAAGKTPIANGFAGSIVTGIVMYQMFTAEFVYSIDKGFDQKRVAKKTTFASSPLWQRMMQAIVQLKDAGCFGPAPQGVSIPSATQQFARGDAAMSILAWAQMPGVLAVNPNLHYSFFNLPSDTASNTVMSAAVSQALGGYAKTQHPNEVKTFISFMARAKQSSLWAKVGGGVAPFDAVKGVFPAYAAPSIPAAKAGKIVVSLHTYLNPNLSIGTSGIAGQIIGLFSGQSTPDSALKALDYLWDNPTSTTAP